MCLSSSFILPGSSPPPDKDAVTANSSMTPPAPIQNSDPFAAMAQFLQSSQSQQVSLN